jgi:hypothetical protein
MEPLEDRTLPSDFGTTNVLLGANVNISRKAGNQNQPTIAVNPTNPNNLVMFSNDESTASATSFGAGILEGYSFDGGKTWTTELIATGKGALPPAYVSFIPEFSLFPFPPPLRVGGLGATFDHFGNMWLSYLDLETDVFGNLHFNVTVAVSTDGGKTLTVVDHILDGGADQPKVAVGIDSVWVAYTDSNAEIAAAGTSVTGLGQYGTFTTPEVVPGSLGGYFGNLAVGPNGEVMVTYQLGILTSLGPDAIYSQVDPDGLGPKGFNTARGVIASTNVGGFDIAVPAQSTNSGLNCVFTSSLAASIDAAPRLAWDLSPDSHTGRVYSVYTDTVSVGSSNTNIYLSYSDDEGNSWSNPVQVTDDPGLNSKFFPTLALDQTTGEIAVAWYDCRNSATNLETQQFVAFSVDGGNTFTKNMQVSAGTSNAPLSEPATPTALLCSGYGDYTDDANAFYHGVFHAVWADNSNSTADNPGGTLTTLDIYTASMTVNTAPKIAQVTTTTPVEGVPLSLSATFTDPDLFQQHVVLIDWGDGTSTTQFSLGAGVQSFSGIQHTYLEENPKGKPYNIQVMVTDDAGASDTFSLPTTVPDAPLTLTPKTLTPVEHTAFNGAVASLLDADPGGTAGDYSGTITWGDGQSSAASFQPNNSGGFDVIGAHTYVNEGNYEVTVSLKDAGGAAATTTSLAKVSYSGVLATGEGTGGLPQVNVYQGGVLLDSFMAYPTTFTGGVRVAVGDVDKDGLPEIVTAPGPGMAPDVRVFDLLGNKLEDFLAYTSAFHGGVNVAVGDVNADGYADIITGADAGGGPHVKVFSGFDNSVLYSFYAYDPMFSGGVRVAAGDVNNDGKADIITAPGAGGGPDVRVWDGATGNMFQEFMAYDSRFLGGVYVAAGDVNADGFADIITGAGAGGGPHVKVFSGKNDSVLQSFYAYASGFTGGVRVAALDTTGGDEADLVTAPGPSGGPQIIISDALSLTTLDSYYAYNQNFTGGVFVGGT